MTALVWFRRDLRVHDHPALVAARQSQQSIVPVFVLDERLLSGRNCCASRTRFLHESLADLDGSLRSAGSRLVIRDGRPERVLPELARECGAETVVASADLTPFARHRDRLVAAALTAGRIELELHPGTFVLDDPAALETRTGGAYTVFSPFHRSWLAAPRRPPDDPPATLPPLPDRLSSERIPSRAEARARDTWPGGETSARQRMALFLAGPVSDYAARHDELSDRGTSCLSPYLHFGCISPRELECRLAELPGDGPAAMRRQLCWRDFYANVLHHFPGNVRSEHQRRYRNTIQWSRSKTLFDAWCEGRTGYPLVDAAMRELANDGWMHNRARLVVGSFLVKDLGIDWRWGERWFMRTLLDGDVANNNGNWQWIASVGVDPQPVSRRIYNPALHQRRYDPGGDYVRRHVPELGAVQDRYLTEPWTMPAAAQRQAGCVIGVDYPAPIVDHGAARREALARYRAAADVSGV